MKILVVLFAALQVAVVAGQGVRGPWQQWSRSLKQCRDDCDCFECVDAVNNGDGTKTVQISSETCKSGTISWMCCIGSSEGDSMSDCEVDSSGSGCDKNKCNGVDILTMTVDEDATSVTIQAHDGQFGTDTLIDTEMCGGNNKGKGGSGCGGNGVCENEVDLSACGGDPAPPVDPTDAPTPVTTSPPTPAQTDPKTDTPTLGQTDPKTDAPIPAPGPTPKPPTYMTGDPHIKKFNGETYDFHGGCDLVLLQNPDFNAGQGLHIHVRTKITRWWSAIETAVVQIGKDTLEIKAGIENRRYWVNGEEGSRIDTSLKLPFQIGGFSGRYRYKNDRVIQYKLNLPNDQSITIRSVKDILRVELEGCNEADFGNSLGLMGSYGEGKLVARNRTTVFNESDTNAFGQHWQVRSTDPQLFHEADGPQYPQECAMPSTSTTATSRRLGVSSITRAQAEKACAHVEKSEFKNCVFDCIAMDDVDAAEGY